MELIVAVVFIVGVYFAIQNYHQTHPRYSRPPALKGIRSPATYLPYDPQRGQLTVIGRLICERCGTTHDVIPASQRSYSDDAGSLCRLQAVSDGWRQIDVGTANVWMCPECSADVLSYARERLV